MLHKDYIMLHQGLCYYFTQWVHLARFLSECSIMHISRATVTANCPWAVRSSQLQLQCTQKPRPRKARPRNHSPENHSARKPQPRKPQLRKPQPRNHSPENHSARKPPPRTPRLRKPQPRNQKTVYKELGAGFFKRLGSEE